MHIWARPRALAVLPRPLAPAGTVVDLRHDAGADRVRERAEHTAVPQPVREGLRRRRRLSRHLPPRGTPGRQSSPIETFSLLLCVLTYDKMHLQG